MADIVGGTVVWNLDVDNSKLKSGLDQAKGDVESTAKEVEDKSGRMKGALSGIGDAFRAGGLAATGFIAAVGGLGVAMANVASNFEQNRIAFETMVGSAEKGRAVLTELSNFAVKTPFELPQLIQASKSLLAYGIEAEKLIPTLTSLGNIAAGVGMDKMPQLILAFGQVKAATKLTGMELRQFTEAGVPLLQALVDQANAAGGQWVTVGATSQKTRDKIEALNDTLTKQNNRMAEMKKNGKTTSATYKNLQIDIQNTKDKIAALGPVTNTSNKVFQKHIVTLDEMRQRITDGEVKFEDVQRALGGLTGEGGRFFNLMEKQSATFGGVMSNIKDQITRTMAEIVGIDIQAGGTIREGSLFAMMKQGAEGALAALNAFTPVLVGFAQVALSNQAVVLGLAGAIGGALVLAVGALILTFGTALLTLGAFLAIGAAVGVGIGLLVQAMGGWQAVTQQVTDVWNGLVSVFNTFVKPALDVLWAEIKNNLLPALGELWNVLGPILGPVLKTLAAIVGGIVVIALRVLIEVLIQVIRTAVGVIDIVNGILRAVGGMVSGIYGAMAGFANAIAQPFMDAWRAIEPIISKIRDGISYLNPFARHSPSLVDNVKKGLGIIKQQYASLSDMAVPAVSMGFAQPGVAPAYAGGMSGGVGGGGVTVNIGEANIKNQQDVEALGREFGFRMNLVK